MIIDPGSDSMEEAASKSLPWGVSWVNNHCSLLIIEHDIWRHTVIKRSIVPISFDPAVGFGSTRTAEDFLANVVPQGYGEPVLMVAIKPICGKA